MTLIVNKVTSPRPKYWTKSEYLNLATLPGAEDAQFFLLRGELIQMPPMGTPHAIGVQNCMYWAINAFRPRLDVRVQMPFDAQGDSMPEPDVAIVTQSENRKSSHPASAELIIEVSNTTLIFDRALSVEYAAAGVPLYWIIDVKRRVMEVRSEVIDDPQSPTGKNYGNLRTLTENDIADTFDPNVRVAVKELLP